MFDSYAYSYKNRGCCMCTSPLQPVEKDHPQVTFFDRLRDERKVRPHKRKLRV